MPHDQMFLDLLNDISHCFIDGDFMRWQSRILLPLSLITAQGPVILVTPEQLKANFELYLMACDAMKLDQIHREVLSLENCEDGSFIGTYETNLLSRGVRATDPYKSSALLLQDDGVFKITSILNARGHHAWTGKPPPTLQ